MTYDEILKNILIEKSKNGFALISVYDSDLTRKNRKNSKRSRKLEELILQNKIEYKKIEKINERKENEIYFILFDSQSDLKILLEEWKKNFSFPVFNVSFDNEELLKFLSDKKFHHPMKSAEKDEYKNRREVFYEAAYEPPLKVGEWNLYKIINENSYIYSRLNSNVLCAVNKMEDGSWIKAYGGYIPCGFNIKKEIVQTREEALKSFSI